MLCIYFVSGCESCYMQAFSSCSRRGLLSLRCALLTVAASLPAGPRYVGFRRCAPGLCGCSVQAQLLRGKWDLPSPGTEPASRGVSTTLQAESQPLKPQEVPSCPLSSAWSCLCSGCSLCLKCPPHGRPPSVLVSLGVSPAHDGRSGLLQYPPPHRPDILSP